MQAARDNTLQNKFNRLRSNKAFELFVVGIIVFSALVIGAKTYDIPPLVSQVIVITDWFITLFFLVEITIRFLGEPHKRNFFKSAWNIFDTLIVIVSLVPIEDSDMALIGRLIRVFRVLRMVSIIPELRILISSLLKAMPQLGYVALLMFIIFYIYGAVGSFFFASINDVLWGDIAISMLTLFRVMTFEDWTDVMYETMEQYPFSWLFYVSFIFLTAFAFLNMIIGIVVNVIESENRARQLEEEGEQPNRADLESQIQQLQASVNELLRRDQESSKREQ
ncbi:ion transporter [Gilvimarinus agarilyticus]|uniref:ion transporter n=1 Tax=unclassified Gilvimarinus TaxID=2642066 RepID=UPI001C0883C3|nr:MULTISPECIES: ion transporter [unclassified Gilvimarinus]MBU2887114.1 ion transporter [Gilvimarinus agarilyticus]MDO6571773.1 ion transporter [Gilvimarinus sp. 2_MG-2023]MDO6745846.1 ion transporter [Gilvimarinus sp. 1_MG-2023]